MRDEATIRKEIEIVKGDIAMAHTILQLQTDDGFIRLQRLFRARSDQITEAICTKTFDGKIQYLGKLQGERGAILEFCKAPERMQKEIQALSRKAERLQTELQQVISRSTDLRFQRQRL